MKDIMEPTISVIVPVCNTEKYLSACLDSVLTQSFQDIEIICVDDGSTDASPDILEQYRERDRRMIVLHQSNQGQSVARNAGIAHAHGEYICFLDSDDMYAPGAMETLAAAAEDDVDIISFETAAVLYENDHLRETENKDGLFHVKKEYSGIMPGREFFTEMVENGDYTNTVWLLLIRRDWLVNRGITFCPDILIEDSVFAFQCYFACERMKHLREKLYIYRIRENSTMTGKYTFRHVYGRIRLFDECIRAIYTSAENEREIRALSTFAQHILSESRCRGDMLDASEKEKVWQLNSLYGLYAKCLLSETPYYNRDVILESLIALIKEYSSIILYGAGAIGGRMQELLNLCGLEDRLLGFAVSGKPAKSVKNGKRLAFIGDYVVSQDTLLIVSAMSDYHKDMVSMARQYGFSKIYVVDYLMECEINRYLANLRRKVCMANLETKI